MGLGVVLTVALDVLLIPRFGASGAAVASSGAYLATAALLVTLTIRSAVAPTTAVLGRTDGVPA
jgi:peptidoglycan biosynthesis protein MviN/MurJ (putative lipid II flippase)